jgi:peptidoglycan/LPS O-acetylase OafA/YrhL
MQISITNPLEQTILFGGIFIAVFIYFFRKKENYTSFSLSKELKGFAILAIIFGHIGYFLSVDKSFLFPFSVLAGVGVNLFLFLSGYGLTVSQIQKNESIGVFYKKRLPKLFVPFWIVLISLFLANYLFFRRKSSFMFNF